MELRKYITLYLTSTVIIVDKSTFIKVENKIIYKAKIYKSFICIIKVESLQTIMQFKKKMYGLGNHLYWLSMDPGSENTTYAVKFVFKLLKLIVRYFSFLFEVSFSLPICQFSTLPVFHFSGLPVCTSFIPLFLESSSLPVFQSSSLSSLLPV